MLAEPLSLPAGDKKFDETFGKELEVYHGPVTARLRLQPAVVAGTPAWVEVVYQGCADAGLCYPPQQREIAVAPVDPEPLIFAGVLVVTRRTATTMPASVTGCPISSSSMAPIIAVAVWAMLSERNW